MCEQCEGLAERFKIEDAMRYRSVAYQIDEMVSRGSLRIVSETSSLFEIYSSEVWPGDSIENVLSCTVCQETFKLSADTYHGSAEWSGALGITKSPSEVG